jgi:glycosyltransferase involved in cell wall biosynthesis
MFIGDPESGGRISVVVPCFNEEQGLAECHSRLTAVLSALGMPYELVYVDDGSRDGTLDVLTSLHAADSHVTVVALSRNFGHQAAVTAGLDAAGGDAVVIIDADLQDPPEVIEEMVRLWRQGYEVIYGVRAERTGESWFKLLTAKLFYRVIHALSDVEIPLDTGDFRLLDRKAVEAMRSMPERHRLLRGMGSWIGFRQRGVSYMRNPRYAGTTKYPVAKMVNLALDGIASFSVAPLRLVTLAGFVVASLSCVGIIYTLVVRLFTDQWVRGWAMLFIGILFLGGVQMISLGIVGEYIGRIYTESKQRPLYLTRAVLSRKESREGAEALPRHRAHG